MENTNPKTFTNVKVYAGDKSKPAADASYRNLLWENFHVDHSFNIGTKIQDSKQIGTIDTWGPLFRVSFDLIIHKFRHFTHTNRSSLLSFRGANCYLCRSPALSLDNKKRHIQFSNIVNKHTIIKNFEFGVVVEYLSISLDVDYFFFPIKLNHWYNIIIEQKPVNVKVSDKTEKKSSSSNIFLSLGPYKLYSFN